MTSGDSAAEPATSASVIPLLPVWRVDRSFDYLIPPELAGRLQVGSLVRIPFGNRKVRGIVVSLSTEPPERAVATISKTVFDVPLAPEPLDGLIEWIARRYAVARGVAFARIVPPRVRAPISDVRVLESAASGTPRPAVVERYMKGSRLLADIRTGAGGVWSLRCLPGEDRGALISELVAAAGYAHGVGAAIVAVPEVRYGSRVLDAVARDWPLLVRVDTAQTEVDRTTAWMALAGGHGLGGGGRSAVLAPAPDARLIVLDEEHHHSYKEDRSPRYDARRVAVERARLQNAVCVLVSSTPSLETGWMVRGGAWNEARPERGARREARPIVEVFEPSADRSLTKELHERVRDTLRAGGRVALLAPSRGYARALWCSACRRSLRCPSCEAGLFYDRDGAQGPGVRCARCGLMRSAPDSCPTCGATEWRYLGAGSERLAEQVASAFPRATVQRMDPGMLADDARARRDPPDIYVTTWIGTKPALRPDVSLVGVLNADALIRKPDFRAAESGYQALAAMSEWAGPADSGGRLVIQSAEPLHHAVQAVVRADHDFFLERELEHRRELGYPPFAELVKVTASGSSRGAIEAAAEVARDLGGQVLGPIDVRAGDGTTADRAREILIKCTDAMPIAEGLRPLLAAAPAGALNVDVDPR